MRDELYYVMSDAINFLQKCISLCLTHLCMYIIFQPLFNSFHSLLTVATPPLLTVTTPPPLSEPAQGSAVVCAPRVCLSEQQSSEQHAQLLSSYGPPALRPEGPAPGHHPAAQRRAPERCVSFVWVWQAGRQAQLIQG